MIKKFISKVDGAEFQYKFNGIDLEIKADGCDWSDFIPEDEEIEEKQFPYEEEDYETL